MELGCEQMTERSWKDWRGPYYVSRQRAVVGFELLPEETMDSPGAGR